MAVFPIVPAEIVRKTMSVAESDLVSKITLEQYPLHESSSNTNCGPTLEKYFFQSSFYKI